jgi:serine O-acetyltransferase
MLGHILSDIRVVTQKESSVLRKIGALSFNLGLHAVILYRISRWLYLHHMMPVALVVSYVNSVLTGAQISPRAKVGMAFEVMHPQGVIVGTTAVIGDRCQLASGVVIGQRYGNGDRPTIGNNFSAGTGAKILGLIKIGDYVLVGANSVVLDSLPSGATAVGIPARIVGKYKNEESLAGLQVDFPHLSHDSDIGPREAAAPHF